MKKITLFFFSIIVALSTFSQSDAIKQYVDTYSSIAINEMIRTGVPAAITLAQGIVESQAGQSDLVKASNNHFGIKCKEEWTGDCVYHDDDLKNECFRVYPSAEESFRDHSDFLKSRPFYTGLFDLDPSDYKAWARGLKKAGYATERDYPQMLIKMIEDNNLQQYTLVAMARMQQGNDTAYAAYLAGIGTAPRPATSIGVGGGDATLAPDSSATAAANDTTSIQQTGDDQTKVAVVQGTSGTKAAAVTGKPRKSIDGDGYPEGVFAINGKKVVYVSAGTSMLSLADKYGIPLKNLMLYNELDSKNDILNDDRLVYLERKPTKGKKDTHIVTHRETLDDIAQEEGVRLSSLLDYNKVKSATAHLATGKKIYLHPQEGTTTAKSSRPAKKRKRKDYTA